MKIRFVGNPQVSPKGEKCVFPVKTIDEAKNRYFSHLWMLDVEKEEVYQFTFGEVSDGSPRWSPDGKRIAFLRTDVKEKTSQIWMIRADGGEAWQLTRMEEGSIGEISWSPDGTKLVCSFRRTHPDWTKEAQKKREESGKSRPPRIVTKLFYRLDGYGFLDLYQHLYVIDAQSGEAKKITDGNWDDYSPTFSPDSRSIAFLSNRCDDPEEKPYEIDVWLVSPEGKELKKIRTPRGYKWALTFSPNGKWLAYFGVETKEDPWVPRNAGLWIVDVQKQKVKCLSSSVDRYVGNVTLSDMREAFAGGESPVWSAKNDQIFSLVSDRGSCNLYSFGLDGKAKPMRDEKNEVYAFSSDRMNRIFVLAVSVATNPGELFLLKMKKGKWEWKQITRFNEEWMREIALNEPEEVWWKSFDGTRIQGWLLKPPDFDPKKKYPVLYYIHGGPHAQYGNTFFHEFHLHAGRGYVVFYSNPRGSMGYEEAFATKIRGNWGDVDYKDILSGADFVASLPYVARSKIAVAGGSYGGYMVNWIVGHTDRFCCAISERSVVNLHSFAGTSDYPFKPDGYWEGNTWERPKKLWQQSPLKYAANVKTPLLIIHSEGDLRCPVGQAEEFFSALKRLKKEVLFLRYPSETSHGLSRSGPPDLRIDRLKHISHWLDRYCKKRGNFRRVHSAGSKI